MKGSILSEIFDGRVFAIIMACQLFQLFTGIRIDWPTLVFCLFAMDDEFKWKYYLSYALLTWIFRHLFYTNIDNKVADDLITGANSKWLAMWVSFYFVPIMQSFFYKFIRSICASELRKNRRYSK